MSVINFIFRAFTTPYCGMTLLQTFAAVAVIVLLGLVGLLIVALYRWGFGK